MTKEDWFYAVLLVFCLFIQALVVRDTFSAELKAPQAGSLYAIAYGSVGHLPQKPPTIVITQRDKMCAIADMKPGCPVRGLQLDDTIYLDETLDFDDPLDASIALHEMAHYVQWDRDGRAKDCNEWIKREEEAYRVQIHALNKIGVDFSSVQLGLIRVRQMRCL